MKVGIGAGNPVGGTPPMEKPVAWRTASASALPMSTPVTAARRSGSSRFAPETSARTGAPPARNTSDFTICPTLVPTASAASCAVRVEVGNSWMRAARPAAERAAWTRSGAEVF
jgi:hypothetical protein